MYRIMIIVFGLMLVMAMGAQAGPPPANGGYLGGWGMNPTDWNNYSGSFSAWGIYDPLGGGGGGPWVIGYNAGAPIYITYTPITLELWVEMYALQTYHYTSYQWHRVGDHAEHLCFDIEGTLQSNNGQYVSLTQATDPLGYLYFRHNIFNGQTPSPAPNLPISWSERWGLGLVYGQDVREGWLPISPTPDLTLLIPDPCDHWFQFEGCMDIPYHQPDGYYSLTMAGCPAPVL